MKIVLQWLGQTWLQKSPSTCEALFCWRTQSKVWRWGWQTCRLYITVDGEWNVQFENKKVVFNSLTVKLKFWISIFDDLCNLSDLGLKNTSNQILVKSFLILKYLSSTSFFNRSSSDGFTNEKVAMCCRQQSGWIQDSCPAPFYVHLPWDRGGCILTSNNSVSVLHKGGHVS